VQIMAKIKTIQVKIEDIKNQNFVINQGTSSGFNSKFVTLTDCNLL